MKKLLLISILAFASMAHAQYNPQILTDIYTGTNPNRGVINLVASAQVNDLLFFNVLDDQDVKVFVTDGTAAGTIQLKTVFKAVSFGVFENHVYFSFVNGTNGVELWNTDGTVAGTTMVAILGGDVNPASNFTVVANKLYFASGNSASPTAKQIYSIEAGSQTPVLLSPDLYGVQELTEYNGRLVFSASDTPTDPNQHLEPYITDCVVGGTTAPVCGLKDINPGATGSSPNSYFEAYGKLYFSANDGTHGNEVWSTDGTESGTQLLMDINPGIGDAMYSLNAGKTDGILLFAANDGVHGIEVWYSYGTASNTALMLDINPSGDARPSGFISLETQVLFTANDGANGSELWITNGEGSNTNLVKDINVGPDPGSFSLYKNNTLCPKKLFFDADNGNDNIEPWVTDGTTAGTRMVADLNPTGASVNYETQYILMNSSVFFAAATGTGRQLFVMAEDCSPLSVATNNSVDFKVFPNPASDVVNIETTGSISKVEIYNSLGQLVLSSVGNKTQIDVSGLNTGFYIMKITGEDAMVSTQKIMIK